MHFPKKLAPQKSSGLASEHASCQGRNAAALWLTSDCGSTVIASPVLEIRKAFAEHRSCTFINECVSGESGTVGGAWGMGG